MGEANVTGGTGSKSRMGMQDWDGEVGFKERGKIASSVFCMFQ